ncbi:FAD-binding domain-containing protein [Flavilitoribacter nigricans]|nr:FAD-binding domain-containing protein [Flavilitoribacter nigricans]
MNDDIVIYWLKRDFRLVDNPALTEALHKNRQVCAIYILEPSFLEASETSAFHVHAVLQALNDLRKKINSAGGQLAIFKGEVVAVLDQLFSLLPFRGIYSHEEIGILRTYERDIAVAKWCKQQGVTWKEIPQTGVFRGLKDRDQRQKLWKQFTFSPILPRPSADLLSKLTIPKKWKSIALAGQRELQFEDTPFAMTDSQRARLQTVSETAAEATLQSFLYERGIDYKGGISSPLTAITAGSRLSVHLAWGTISGRRVYQATQARKEELKISEDQTAKRWRASLTSFLSRLHWRDHFIQRLETEPKMELEPLNPAFKELQYDNRSDFLSAWTNGRTGFPLVDACIRCLQVTGFINFRMRAMLASVACHTLHLDWRLIDHPMASMYTDYEPGIHISQLQMQASVVGINTVRIYSPNKQIVDQDPDTIFIKEWVPELRDFSAEAITKHRQEALGDYPAQLVDWWAASREMKDRIWTIRKLAASQQAAREVYEKHGSRKGPRGRKGNNRKNKTHEQ